MLITGDRTLPYEQNRAGRKIALVCLSAAPWSVIEPFADDIVAALDRARTGLAERVECGLFSRKSARRDPSY